MRPRRNGEELRAAYRRRRRRVVRGLVVFGLVGGAGTLVGTLVNGGVGAVVFLVAAAVWAVWFFRTWRCPACGRSLLLADAEEDLSHCPHCDARLQDQVR